MDLIARLRSVVSHPSTALLVVVAVGSSVAGCTGRAVLSEQADAQRLASALHVQMATAQEATNRAVLSDTDESSNAAAKEAEAATAAAQQRLEELQVVVRSLGYADEIKLLEAFRAKFDEYRKLDAEILPLSVENTNLKAQRLSFGTGAEAAEATFNALNAMATSARAADVDALVLTVRAAVLQIQVLQARHNAEADEAQMSSLEAQMSTAETSARAAMSKLALRQGLVPGGEMTTATDAFERFLAINREIVALSRRNSNVRSMAVTLGRSRLVAAECDDQLRALEERLASHSFQGSR